MPLRLALAAFALAALCAGRVDAQPAYYCDTWGAYYPGVQTCPVLWRVVNPAPGTTQQRPPPLAPPIAEQTTAYRQGDSDWRDLQAWFELQKGDRRAGADFWAGNRSKLDHKSCEDASGDFSGDKSAFAAGCLEAKRRLDPIDDRRRSEPEYRSGFNNAAKQLPIRPADAAARAPIMPPPPAVSSTFTINNRTCLKISGIKIDDSPRAGGIGPGDSGDFKIENDRCSHSAHGTSDNGLEWNSHFECKDMTNQHYAINWTSDNSPSGTDMLESEALIVESRSNGSVSMVQLTRKRDCLAINRVDLNRGNCKSGGLTLPATLKFGQTVPVYYFCEKLLELNVATDRGDLVYTFDR
jgi:hypothetical protein